MSDSLSTRGATRAGRSGSAPLPRLARRLLVGRLAALRDGRIALVEGPDRTTFGGEAADGLEAEIEVLDPRFYTAVALGGSIGAAESYARGEWRCDDLTALLRLLARDRGAGLKLEGGWARLGRMAHRAVHLLRRNTRAGSRRNIAAHYDLGNDFFGSFLDPTLSYSCAIFPTSDAALAEASRHRNDVICRKLELAPGERLLEIGSGWGGLALQAAGDYGCRVTTVTISRRQHELAARRIREAGLADRVTLLLEDYRRLPTRLDRPFDKLVSVEMIEAVGHERLDDYFRVCGGMLAPDGRMLLQAIVIADRIYDSYRSSVDFIQRHIFPGGALPSLGAIAGAVGRASDLRPVHLQDITEHYPPTLRIWRERLRDSRPRLLRRGYGEDLLRMWDFYFCYCEAGFLERMIGDVQLLLAKPGDRRPALGPGFDGTSWNDDARR